MHRALLAFALCAAGAVFLTAWITIIVAMTG